jgi:hypothetical protein
MANFMLACMIGYSHIERGYRMTLIYVEVKIPQRSSGFGRFVSYLGIV